MTEELLKISKENEKAINILQAQAATGAEYINSCLRMLTPLEHNILVILQMLGAALSKNGIRDQLIKLKGFHLRSVKKEPIFCNNYEKIWKSVIPFSKKMGELATLITKTTGNKIPGYSTIEASLLNLERMGWILSRLPIGQKMDKLWYVEPQISMFLEKIFLDYNQPEKYLI